MTEKQIENLLQKLFQPLRDRVNKLAEEARPRVWAKIKKRIETEQKRAKSEKTTS